jgi:uncharacterized membrane protein YqhA
MERVIETLMYRSRWLLAPIYLGLSVALIALGIKFFQEVIHLLLHIMELKVFMDAQDVENAKIMWYILLHITFVASAFAMGYLDILARDKD